MGTLSLIAFVEKPETVMEEENRSLSAVVAKKNGKQPKSLQEMLMGKRDIPVNEDAGTDQGFHQDVETTHTSIEVDYQDAEEELPSSSLAFYDDAADITEIFGADAPPLSLSQLSNKKQLHDNTFTKNEKSKVQILEQEETGIVLAEYRTKTEHHIEKLQSELRDSNAAATKLEQKYSELLRRINEEGDVKANLAAVLSERNALEIRLEKSKEDCSTAKSELGILKVEINKHKMELGRYKSDLESKINECVSAKKDIDSLQNELRRVTADYDRQINEFSQTAERTDEQVRVCYCCASFANINVY